MASALSALGALAVIGGGLAIGYATTRKDAGGMTPAQSAAMASAVGQLDGEIKAARTAVHERADTLAQLPVVRTAILTDATTVADQVAHGELQFTPRDGETLELGRTVPPARTAESLMLQPAGAARRSHGGAPGIYAELVAEQLVITEVTKVVPLDAASPIAGFLSVTRPLGLAPALQPLREAGITGKLVLGSGAIAIGAMPPGATTREWPLSSQDGARIVAAEPAPHAVLPVPILAGGGGAIALGFLLLGLAVMRKRPAASTAQPAPPPGTGLGNAQTQLSATGAVATGTPSPVDPAIAPGRVDPAVHSNLAAGATIGRWEVVRQLGSGGMAEVYLAHVKGDGGFEKLVAIKVMHGHLARNQRAVDHFLDEARLAARIHHPNVVAIQDLGKIGNDYVIVMEYVDGVDLERLLMAARAGGRPVPLAVALGILSRICDGLDAAHRATAPDGSPLGIIHRDVKSANVLVSRQGIVKVVDFGIAKATKQVHYTVAGETKGTPAMMAPEQRVGAEVDVRVDVYAAAAVGYELVTGQGVNLDLAALAHLGIENWPHLPLPSSLRADLPRELDAILLGSMAYERDRRAADCAALGQAIETVIGRYQLAASDKDIARWVEGELRLLASAHGGPAAHAGTPPVG